MQPNVQKYMENFIDLCRHRRSIRRYTAQPVEREKIDYMLRCALMSPSAKRLNPWEFVVVQDILLKENVVSVMVMEEFVRIKPLLLKYLVVLMME